MTFTRREPCMGEGLIKLTPRIRENFDLSLVTLRWGFLFMLFGPLFWVRITSTSSKYSKQKQQYLYTRKKYTWVYSVAVQIDADMFRWTLPIISKFQPRSQGLFAILGCESVSWHFTSAIFNRFNLAFLFMYAKKKRAKRAWSTQGWVVTFQATLNLCLFH